MTTATIAAAKERQLDWLLAEVLGAARRAAAPKAMPWLAAAVALFAIGVALGVAWLRAPARNEAQEPSVEPRWHECHGAGELAAVPADVTHLRCFDFDDAACAQLGRIATGAGGLDAAGGLSKLTHLDLSGMDVNARGVARSIPLTDVGVRALAPLTHLRWLSLAQCHAMQGEGLQVLEAMPRLEHLDLTYSGVESPAVERLARLPSLRTLVLSHCMNFHGRSLAAVAQIPGLRRLELRACTTLAAKNVLHLVQLKELRHLDLRDCQGRFRGQTASGFSTSDEEPPPVQDGIGITDAVVAALSALPLETFLLGGSESLTDAIGASLAKMTTLRSLDLSNLPKTTSSILQYVPAGMEALAIDDNPQWAVSMFKVLPPLPGLREFGLSGLPTMSEGELEFLLRGKSLRVLRLSGVTSRGKEALTFLQGQAPLGASTGSLVASQRELQRLELRNVSTLEPAFLAELAALQHLTEIDLTASGAGAPGTMRELGRCRALRSLKLMWCKSLTIDGLRDLAGCPLAQLDVYGTKLDPVAVQEVARAWPGCIVTLPKGQRWRSD